jgi:two-component system chemotaxis response regulator CheB
MEGQSLPAFGHDTIVIGASSGGLDPLRVLLRALPEDLRATILVVMHVGASSHLAGILDRVASLPVVPAVSGAPLRLGTITVAEPGRHLLIHDDHILLRRGPRENSARPAIDPLFRTAAASRGGRVIGVVLSGALNDGTAGLRAIKRCGGLAIVQDPADAAVPDMPQSAIRHAQVDAVIPASRMAERLALFTREPAGKTPETPLDIRLEALIAAQDLGSIEMEEKLGDLSPFTCPDCGGALWEIRDGSMLRYRCHVGHAFTAESVLSASDAELDKTLEGLVRFHRERGALVRRLADYERSVQNDSLARQFDARAKEYDQDAELVRRLARHRSFDMTASSGGDEGDEPTDEATEDQET